MADFSPNAPAPKQDVEKAAPPAEAPKEEPKKEEAAPEGDGEGEDKGAKPEGEKPDGGKPKPEGKPEGEPKEGDEPNVRRKHKSAKDYIIERKNRQLEKVKAKADPDEKGDEGAEDEIAPEDEELVTKVVEKKFGPTLKKIAEQEDEGELRDFLAENPDFKPYEAKIRRYMAHPSRAQVPVSAIAYEVAGPELLKLGAKRVKEADDKAKAGRAGGGSSREDERGGKKSVNDMTPAEFRAYKEEVRLRGQRG